MSLINNIKINSLSEAQEILKAAGDKLVTVDMHNNAGRNEIYRIKFD